MESSLDIIDPITYPQWDALVQNDAACSFFHSSYWANVLHETYGYRPVYFTAVDEGRLSVLIPVMEVDSIFTGKRGVSIPFSDYCELKVAANRDIREIMAEVADYGKRARWKSIQFTDGKYFDRDVVPCSEYYGHILNLEQEPDVLFRAFSTNTKRNIQKAQKQEVVVQRDLSLDAVRHFYRLHCMTRKRHGSPPQPYRFFKNIHKHIITSGHGFIMLASCKGKIVAGSIYFYLGDQAIFKFGASDSANKHLNANSLIMWTAIEWLRKNGIKWLSFGRTDHDNEGLRHYKRGWGSVERKINYYKYDLQADAFVVRTPRLSEFQLRVNRILPLFVLRGAGAILYKHIG